MEKYIGVKIIEAEPLIKEGKEGYKVIYPQPDGGTYESWSPSNIFEEAYRKTDGLTFGLAIEAIKKGEKVARSGWNSKNMWIGYVHAVPLHKDEAYIRMKTVNGTFIPWLASQADILTNDWRII